MSRATTRQSAIKSYMACKNCEDNISGYGKCNKGYDNFYYRLGKDNGCDKCKDEKYERRWQRELIQSIKRK